MKAEQPATQFLHCPRCGRKARTLAQKDTELIRFPLFCPKCRYECVVTFYSLSEAGSPINERR